MKRLIQIVIVGILLLAAPPARSVSQGRGYDDRSNRPERLEKYKKMRLVEVLKLNEDDAVRFFAKQSAHEDTQRELMKSRNSALNDIQEIVRGKGDPKDLGKLTDQVQDADQKVFAERQRYQEEMKKFLSQEQFAKFLLFERNFNRQVMDALEEMRQDHPKN